MRLLDIDDRYSLVNYINEDCISSYKMKANMERIDEQFFKPWARYLEEAQLSPDQINQIFQAAHKEAQASGTNSTMLGKVIEKIIPDSMLQKLSDSLPEPDPNAANDPQFANKASAAVNQLPVDADTKSGLMKIVANAAKNPAVQPIILSLVGGVLGGLVQKVGPSLNAFGLPGTVVAGVSGAVVAGGVAVALAKIQGKSWKEAFKGAIKPALAGAAGAVLGKMAADFVGNMGSGSSSGAGGEEISSAEAKMLARREEQGRLQPGDAEKLAQWRGESEPNMNIQGDKPVGRIDWDAEAGGGTQKFSGTMVANEPVVPGQPLSPQQMAVVDMSKSMGNTPSPEVQAAYDLSKQGGSGGVQAAQASSNYRTLPDDPTGMGAASDYKPVDTGSLRQGGAPGGVAFPGDPGYVPPEQAGKINPVFRNKTRMPQTQSREYLGNRLSEGQCYLLMKRIAAANRDMIIEGHLVLEAGMMQKAGTWLKTKAQNVTQQVTADKLMQAWKKAGSPTDSNAVADIMTQAGVNAEVVKKVYTGMQLPEPGKEGTADAALTPAETWKYTNPTTGTEYEAGNTKDGQLIINFDGEWETVEDEDDRKAILAAKDGGQEAAPDFETVKAQVLKMPMATRVQIVNYMKNELKVA